MSESEPEVVYRNLVLAIPYRGGVITSEILTPEKLSSRLIQSGYATIQGERKSTDVRGAAHIIMVMIASGAKVMGKSADFAGLIASIYNTNGKGDHLLEVVLVLPAEPTSHISKVYDVAKRGYANMRLDYRIYDIFMCEVPAHVLVPLHEIMTSDEITTLCRTYYLSPEQFPAILPGDPASAWWGIRPGMMVRIHRHSETAGFAIAYRHCR